MFIKIQIGKIIQTRSKRKVSRNINIYVAANLTQCTIA